MNKNALVAALALVVVSGWLVGARAQEPSPPGEGPDPDPAFSIKGEPSYGTPAPGQVGGPVASHPELRTPEHLKEETEAVKEYCLTHDCSSAVVEPRPAGYGESIDRANRAWVSSHPSGVADPTTTASLVTTSCRPDPDHPAGLEICTECRANPANPDKPACVRLTPGVATTIPQIPPS